MLPVPALRPGGRRGPSSDLQALALSLSSWLCHLPFLSLSFFNCHLGKYQLPHLPAVQLLPWSHVC